MNIILTDSKTVLTEGAFRKQNKNTSFPIQLTDETLSGFGAAVLNTIEMPNVEPGKKLVFDGGEQVDGKWQEKWSAFDMTAEEITLTAKTVRKDRDALLIECDWTQLGDVSVADTWKNYRQQLRDLPASEGFPLDVTWPTKP